MKKALFTALAIVALGSASFAQITPAKTKPPKKAEPAKTATTGGFKAAKSPLAKPIETAKPAEKKTETPAVKAKKS